MSCLICVIAHHSAPYTCTHTLHGPQLLMGYRTICSNIKWESSGDSAERPSQSHTTEYTTLQNPHWKHPTPLPVCIIYSGRPTMWLSYPVSHTKLAHWMTFIGRYSTFLEGLRIFMSAWDHNRKIKGQQLFRNLESVITTIYYVIHIVAMQWSKMNLQRGSASITNRTQMLKVFVSHSILRRTW